jgi:predicted MFS family arabinose efflux permease
MLLRIGSVIIVFALMMTSISKQYYQLFLTQGLLLGVGISFVILPAFSVIPRYFVQHRGLAMGLTVSGSSMGGVIWPIALKNLFAEVGFGWGVRIGAFIMLPLLTVACFTVKLPKSANRAAGQPKPKADFSVIRQPVLILLAIGLFFVFLGLFTPFFYITAWTDFLGLNSSMAFYMISIINSASLFGRILPGLWADTLGPYNIMIMSISFSGLICCCWTQATTIVGIAMLSLAYGFVSGAVIGLQGPCTAAVVPPQQYGLAMGSVFGVLSIAYVPVCLIRCEPQLTVAVDSSVLQSTASFLKHSHTLVSPSSRAFQCSSEPYS